MYAGVVHLGNGGLYIYEVKSADDIFYYDLTIGKSSGAKVFARIIPTYNAGLGDLASYASSTDKPSSKPGFPSTLYPYAGSVLTVAPYPAVVDQPVTLGTILQNPTDTPATVAEVQFSVSAFGIGLPWEPVGSVTDVLIPAATTVDGETVAGSAHPTLGWTPTEAGVHGVEAVLAFPDGTTQRLARHIDVLALSDGRPASTSFKVGNPTGAYATVDLKLVPVAEEPEGWSAILGQTSVALSADTFADIDLTIVPPAGAPSGSYATYHVEGYVGETLIGGIAKTVFIGEKMPCPEIHRIVRTPEGYIVYGSSLPGAVIRSGSGSTVADEDGGWGMHVDELSWFSASIGGVESDPVGGLSVEAPDTPVWTEPDLPLSGWAPPGATVEIYVHNPYTGETVLWTTATAGPDGRWITLIEGIYDCLPEFWVEVDGANSDSVVVITDSHPPVVTHTLAEPEATGWYRTRCVSLGLEAVDPPHGTGVDLIEYSLDGGATWQAYASGAEICGEGVHELRYRASDMAGNLSEPGAATVAIDTEAPVTTAEVAGEAGEPGWYRSEVSVTLTATDAVSGVERTEYSLDGGVTWQPYGAALRLTEEGEHTVHYRSVDVAGNEEEPCILIVIIDRTPPTIVPGSALIIAEATGPLTGVDLGPVEAFDRGEPCGCQLTHDAPAAFPLGETTVTWSATDPAGNVATAPQTVTVRDTTPPAITVGQPLITVEATGPLTAVDLGPVSATDLVDGPCSPDHVCILESDAPGAFEVGETVVSWRATDAAGNVGRAEQVCHVEDTTPPEFTLTRHTDTLWPPNHKMVLVATVADVHDLVDGDPQVDITVSSNEPLNGAGDGNTASDWYVERQGDVWNVYVRSERAGDASGRTYAIDVTVSDRYGNRSTATTAVSVPHDMGGKGRAGGKRG